MRQRGRETGRERYYRQVREIRETLGISHDQARQRWRDYYAPGGDPIKPVKRLQLAIRASTSNQRTCPFCRDAIYHPDEGGPDYICENCQAHYHLDCFEDELQGRCATLGCSTRRVINRARRVRIQTRGHRTPDVTPATPITRAREDGATVQEVDPEDYRRQQEAARAAQRRGETQDTPEPETVQQAPRERLWWRLLNLAEDNLPVAMTLGLGVVFLIVILLSALLA